MSRPNPSNRKTSPHNNQRIDDATTKYLQEMPDPVSTRSNTVKRIYVSIDMDFWNGLQSDVAENYLRALLQIARPRRIPIHMVYNHQQLTRHVDRSRANVLINIDQHSDLCGTDIQVFSCGSWVAYVRNRQNMLYRWVHRHHVYQGECNGSDHPIFTTRTIHREYTDFKKIERRRVTRAPRIHTYIDNCVGIGICLSPSYTDENFRDVWWEIVHEFKLPYENGNENEYFNEETRFPPKPRPRI